MSINIPHPQIVWEMQHKTSAVKLLEISIVKHVLCMSSTKMNLNHTNLTFLGRSSRSIGHKYSVLDLFPWPQSAYHK